jgi:D-beta-D-heptose 7-phosphate kinase/D-beta-D-heptose 1-phosphate adenosyltransferase
MLLEKETLANLCDEVRSNKKIVFTNGCFDLIHAGHCQYLTEAKKLGDILILGLNSDNSVKRLKGENRPINNELDRAAVLSALKPIDYVCVFEEDTPYELIKAVKPHTLVKGGDYKADDIVGNDIAEQTVVLSFLEGRSTTRIIDKMK